MLLLKFKRNIYINQKSKYIMTKTFKQNRFFINNDYKQLSKPENCYNKNKQSVKTVPHHYQLFYPYSTKPVIGGFYTPSV